MAMHFAFGPPRRENERPTLHERFAALRYVPPLIKLVWETHRGYTMSMALLRLMRSGDTSAARHIVTNAAARPLSPGAGTTVEASSPYSGFSWRVATARAWRARS